MKPARLFIFLILFTCNAFGQKPMEDSVPSSNNIRFKYEALIMPAVLIGFGVAGLETRTVKAINADTKVEITENIDEKVSIDDFSQYSTFLSVYALNATGVKGKNNFKNRTVVLTTAYLLMGIAVNVIKLTGNEVRPDGTTCNSFPSGHTATAFMGAEFLYQEYKHQSIWYGLSGYLVAAGTGFYRMQNNRHWLTDITAGAGIGILSTKIAYWSLPLMKNSIFKNKEHMQAFIIPTYHKESYCIGVTMCF
jgi:membrane-associated phospholipid phosphatase